VGVDRAVTRNLYYWRLFATGFCFAIFGVGGLLIGLVVTPLVRVCVWNRPRRQRTARLLVHYSFRTFVALMKFVGVLTYEIHGRELLRAPRQVVIATHRTLIDVVFLVACIPNAVCIIKQRLFRNFAVGSLVRSAGYISNTDPEQLLKDSIDALNAGATLVIFPEGTRSADSSGMRLRRGAAYVALATQTDLTPVSISCSPTTLTKFEHWYEIPDRRVHFRLRVGSKIAVGPSNPETSTLSAARAVTDRVRDYFLEDTRLYE
jgi:1-acyl-sn-glycerol-3-phosphate acyltransferase